MESLPEPETRLSRPIRVQPHQMPPTLLKLRAKPVRRLSAANAAQQARLAAEAKIQELKDGDDNAVFAHRDAEQVCHFAHVGILFFFCARRHPTGLRTPHNTQCRVSQNFPLCSGSRSEPRCDDCSTRNAAAAEACRCIQRGARKLRLEQQRANAAEQRLERAERQAEDARKTAVTRAEKYEEASQAVATALKTQANGANARTEYLKSHNRQPLPSERPHGGQGSRGYSCRGSRRWYSEAQLGATGLDVWKPCFQPMRHFAKLPLLRCCRVG